MSANRIPPPFPQPFRNSNSAPNATGTEQRSIPPAQGFAYPPETHIPRGPPNGGPPQIPPRPPHSYAPIPPYQHTHGSVQTHPTSFPMPQVPYPHVPTIPSGPPPFMAQRSEATHVPSYMHNPPQVAPPPPYPSPLHVPTIMSHSVSRDSRTSHTTASYTPRNQDDSNGAGHGVGQGFPTTHDSDSHPRPKGPPSGGASGVQICRKCKKLPCKCR